MRSPTQGGDARPAVAIALSVVLSLSVGCSPGGDGGNRPRAQPSPALSPSPLGAPSTSPGPPGPGLARFYRQKPVWRSCRGDKLCARVRVPLDYADPGGRTLSLAVLKIPAGDPRRRVGSLVVNPGGPGASGVEYAAQATQYFGSALRRSFDIVGFDPRGVGASAPVDCLSDRRLDEFVASDPAPETSAEARRGDRMLAAFGQGCVQRSGALAAHISTWEVARDMDVLRAVLGDAKLVYFGASYGTLLGATYADLFPKRVGRMVLDGAIDPSVGSEDFSLVQARGFETALRAYVGDCMGRGDCFLGGSVDEALARIRRFLDDVDARPLPATGGRQLTVGNAVLGIWAPLYNKQFWFALDAALSAAFRGDGAPLLRLSDAYTSRGPDGYLDNSLEALYAVSCLDSTGAIPTAQVPRHLAEFRRASPTFGAMFAYGLASCARWPVGAGRSPAPVRAPGAPPILVVGTTRDPATPLKWAQGLARQLRSGVLVRRNGDGHTGYLAGNRCVDQAVESYLVSGRVPAGEVRC